ncbi:SUR7-domain-containing protein [Suhomyces tanzawaensis NRRL Y-17324]|uniref:SUR7-domain-containing protein n=1 Tax=Suhomyces tanzawaensis NRRL Y-17324 TaxID=984487 RepID=A0A1E4SQS8_9ASCO|nr:SUR7-domain-containing protein [Suhomyces tanzawaensis NRRL Y-17324]ODV81866.1 SUR7-domain-containing protein [Suhomyces tanzawaensis NRRL Y-17324]
MKLINGIINQFFLAGTILLLLFTVLSGSSKHFPLNRFYWIRANTSGIQGAPQEGAWTFWGVCEYDDFSQCQSGPAYPISPRDNFDTSQGVPQDFITNRSTYYYLSRFSFAFTLIALGLSSVSFLLGFVMVTHKTIVFTITLALIFVAATAAFQTAVVVLARNAFNDDNLNAHIGLKSMAILWASVVTLLIVWANTFSAKIVASYRKHLANVNGTRDHEVPTSAGPAGDESSFTRSAPAAETKEDNGGGIRFFKIKRNHKTSDEESV